MGVWLLRCTETERVYKHVIVGAKKSSAAQDMMENSGGDELSVATWLWASHGGGHFCSNVTRVFEVYSLRLSRGCPTATLLKVFDAKV